MEAWLCLSETVTVLGIIGTMLVTMVLWSWPRASAGGDAPEEQGSPLERKGVL